MIAKRLTGIIVLGAMMLLTGCSGDGYTPELLAIDSILNEKPESDSGDSGTGNSSQTFTAAIRVH